MSVKDQIKSYIESQVDAKRSDMQAMHTRMLKTFPKCKLWFFDGTDDKGKVVANPNIGYGTQTLRYANGSTREWFRIGISGNTTGISVYVMGLEDKSHLKNAYGSTIGKASVTGYCIKFKALKDVNEEVLWEAIAFGMKGE